MKGNVDKDEAAEDESESESDKEEALFAMKVMAAQDLVDAEMVTRVVAEKESTGRHVLLRVSSDRRGRSDHQSEPSEGP